LENQFAIYEKYVDISKVYIDTFRADKWVEEEKLNMVKDFFQKKNIKVSGGITTISGKGKGEFVSFCYSKDEDRNKLRDIVTFNAKNFDESIFDDFYFTNCKCKDCVKAKGEKTWDEYRNQLMSDVSKNIVMATAKRVNPNSRMIIKYPNWYEHYQYSGYNLEAQPDIFDMIYAGCETRDPENTQQHLPKYLSYFIMRYLENVKPGKNGGGWFDAIDCIYNIGSYVEQGYLTLLSKAKEMTLFSFSMLVRGEIFLAALGCEIRKLDNYLGELGTPVGISCYKPFNSSGEDHLFDYLGMIGLPLEPTPRFEEDAKAMLLTADAAKDPKIIDRIKARLLKGKNVVITTGLLKALQGTGIEDLAQVSVSDRKVSVEKFGYQTLGCAFKSYIYSKKEILIPQVDYKTNDSWPVIVAFTKDNNFPIVVKSSYGDGSLFILTIPEDFAQIYNYPEEVLSQIRGILWDEVKLESESQVGLFTYDNDTFVLESFLGYNSTAKVSIKGAVKLKDIRSDEELAGIEVNGNTVFDIGMMPTTYCVFKIVR